MFVIMTVYTEILPVGTIGWIVLSIAVFMVNSEELSVFVVKFPGAFGTDKAVNLK